MTLHYQFNTGLYRSNGKIIPTLATNNYLLKGHGGLMVRKGPCRQHLRLLSDGAGAMMNCLTAYPDQN